MVVITEEDQREDCPECLRPVTVCWCPYLARPRVTVRTRLVVLQHPGETKRNIRTCRMLELGLAPHCVSVITGRKFPGSDQEVGGLLSAPGTRLLYPGPDSEPLDQVEAATVETLVILDGTWEQARKIYSRNPAVQALRKVSLSVSTPSQYIVRTQPNSACMSTLEVSSLHIRSETSRHFNLQAGVHSLAILERRPEMIEPLLAPLVAMCNFQINHGAVSHDSKELKQQQTLFKQENKQFQKRKPQFRR